MKREKKYSVARFLKLWDKEDIIITLAVVKSVISLGRIGQAGAPDIISTPAPRKLQNIAKIAGKSMLCVKINKNDIKVFKDLRFSHNNSLNSAAHLLITFRWKIFLHQQFLAH